MRAAYEGNTDRVRELLAAGADVNARIGMNLEALAPWNSNNWTALFAAVHRKDAGLVRTLLDAGADPNIDDTLGTLPLNQAFGSEEIAMMLISAGSDVNCRDGTFIDEYGEGYSTPLHAAVGCNLPNAVRVLLARGANVHAKTSAGWTPMHWARSLEVINLLRKAGGDIDALDRRANTPLALAVSRSWPKQAHVLIEAGADVGVSCQRIDGVLEPLILVAVDNCMVGEETQQDAWREIIKSLVAHGADINEEA